jgi:peptide/nickel transport system substrate-binding protein
VKITLLHPWAPFLSDMSLFANGIYPMAYFKKVGAGYMSSHPVGTGPYKFVSWKRGQYLRLTKNTNYWAASKYPMQNVEYDLLPNDNTRLLKLESDSLDVDNVLPYNQIAGLRKNSNAHVDINPSTQTNYFVGNLNTVPQLKDVYVREAISHAIDRPAIVKAVQFGIGSPANSFMPRGALDYDPNLPVPAFDVKLAQSLLKKSKYPKGFTMTVEIAAGNNVYDESSVILKSELAAIGITVNLKSMDQTTLFNDQTAGKYHFTYNIWTNDIPDPDELVAFTADYTGGAKSFYSWYNNPQLIQLSHQAEQSDNPDQRQQLYFKIQQIWEKQQWIYALTYSPFVNGVSNRVHGFSENPLGYFNLQGVTKS